MKSKWDRFFNDSLRMLFERFAEKNNCIATFSNRMEVTTSSEASFDKASELTKAVSDLAGCSDAIFYDPSCRVLYILVYAEISGPITEKEKTNIEGFLLSEELNKVLISVFSDRHGFAEVADQIAWGTKVWIANEPDHMIHYDDKPVIQAR